VAGVPDVCISVQCTHSACQKQCGAPSVALSAHATRAGASREVDVFAAGTHSAGGVADAEWLAATLGGGDVTQQKRPLSFHPIYW